MISDLELTAEEMGRIKGSTGRLKTVCTMYWMIHSVKTGHRQRNQSTIWRWSGSLPINILRIAILYGDCAEIMTEAMDDFSDDLLLRKKYVFSGIVSFTDMK